MSAALVRQALEFVDEESGRKPRNKRRARNHKIRGPVQDTIKHPYKINKKKIFKPEQSSQTVEKNVEKLLVLSKPATDSTVAEKIIERAIKGKPLLQKIEIKTENEKSILFPDEEPFTKFEKDYFCS